MSTSQTPLRNYTWPEKDENLESSNAFLRVTIFSIDSDIGALFANKANSADVDLSTVVDSKIATAVSDYDDQLDIYGSYTTGDVQGTTELNLRTDTMATPGVYTKLTVNNKGLVTGGTTMTLSDLTDWNAANWIANSRLNDTLTTTTNLWSSQKISDYVGSVSSSLGNYVLLSDYSDADVLAKLLNVDGPSSGLNADLLDDQHGAFYLDWANFTGLPTTLAGYGISDAVSINSVGTVTSAPTVNVDLSLHEVFTFDMNQDVTFTVSNLVEGQRGSFLIKQDAVGGWVMTTPVEAVFEGNSKSLSTAANTVDKIDYVTIGGVLYCTLQKDFS